MIEISLEGRGGVSQAEYVRKGIGNDVSKG